MKNILLITTFFISILSSSVVFSREIQCASNTQELAELSQKYDNQYNVDPSFPKGLYIFEDDYLENPSINFFVDQNGGFVSFVITGRYYATTAFSICNVGKKLFIYLFRR